MPTEPTTEQAVRVLTMTTYECDRGCGFYKNNHRDPGATCRLVGCGGTIREVFWQRIPPAPAVVYPADHAFKPGKFSGRCLVQLVRYPCPYDEYQHDPDLSAPPASAFDPSRLHHGICPGCGEDKFIGHGPLCSDCFASPPAKPPVRCICEPGWPDRDCPIHGNA